MTASWDESLLEDFLAEAGELIEQLDADLIRLEKATPADAAELLNRIFRALHTVKGAAGFLNIEAIIRFAHAAEDALNVLRKDASRVNAHVIDILLRSVDVLRGMIDQLGGNQQVQPCPPELIEDLHAVTQGGTVQAASPTTSAPIETVVHEAAGARQLVLPPQKQDLLGFMTADLHDTSAQVQQCLDEMSNHHDQADAAMHLDELIQGLQRTIVFFELPELNELVAVIQHGARAMITAEENRITPVIRLLKKVCATLDQHADALDHSQVLALDITPIRSEMEAILSSAADAVTEKPVDPTPQEDATTNEEVSASAAAGANNAAATGQGQKPTDKTIRVELSRLESLLNMVGQLVLTKNRMLSLARKLLDQELPAELCEEISGGCNDLERVTASLQMGVMRTRMQPLAKLFDRYPRVIRDIARMTHKEIQLDIQGAETEVDKGVIELLADPLVHILRNSADHGVEKPEDRVAAGKPQAGTIKLEAQHQGSYVRLAITDDGKGIDRQVIGEKAVEKGLASADQVAAMSDAEVFRFIFAAGLSTAKEVSDLSGRGVGMDVVQTNVNQMNGKIQVSSTKGVGTTIEILIPLTVAIMPAMAVQVGKHLYCVPLQNIGEIVRPQEENLSTVQGQPVIRLRQCVLPLLDLRQRLNETAAGKARFAVVIHENGQRIGLLVDRLIGQQDIVIKPLDDIHTKGGPFSGATIQDDGRVSLILDVPQLIHQARLPASAAPRKAA